MWYRVKRLLSVWALYSTGLVGGFSTRRHTMSCIKYLISMRSSFWWVLLPLPTTLALSHFVDTNSPPHPPSCSFCPHPCCHGPVPYLRRIPCPYLSTLFGRPFAFTFSIFLSPPSLNPTNILTLDFYGAARLWCFSGVAHKYSLMYKRRLFCRFYWHSNLHSLDWLYFWICYFCSSQYYQWYRSKLAGINRKIWFVVILRVLWSLQPFVQFHQWWSLSPPSCLWNPLSMEHPTPSSHIGM